MPELVEVLAPADEQEGTESRIGRWFKAVGDKVTQHEPLLELNTDKVTVEVPAPASGILTEILKSDDEEVAPSEVLGFIDPADMQPAGNSAHVKRSSDPSEPPNKSKPTKRLSPAVKQLVKEHGIDISKIKGSGSDGRITHSDLERHLATQTPGNGTRSHRKRHSDMRRRIAEHMVHSALHTAPHVTTVFEANFSNVIAHRAKMKAAFADKGIPLTLSAYIVQATTHALKAVPEANSRWHEDELELFDECHIGIAVALGSEGLLVPVIKNAEQLSLEETAQVLHDLTERARLGDLSPAELKGGTFTISNHGVSGSLFAAPIIINQPQSAILGIGKIEPRVNAKKTKSGAYTTEISEKAYISLTIDHRVLDGYQANTFLQVFCSSLTLVDNH